MAKNCGLQRNVGEVYVHTWNETEHAAVFSSLCAKWVSEQE